MEKVPTKLTLETSGACNTKDEKKMHISTVSKWKSCFPWEYVSSNDAAVHVH